MFPKGERVSCLVFSNFAIPWTVVCQASLSMGFPRQEYWNRLPFPSTGDLPIPGTEPVSLMFSGLAGRLFPTSTTWEDLSNLGKPQMFYRSKVI